MIRISTIVVFVILALAAMAPGQAKKYQKSDKAGTSIKKDPKSDKAGTNMARVREDLVTATKQYKESLEKLLPYEEQTVKSATDTLEKRKSLLDQGIVSKREVEDTERLLADAQTKLAETKKKMAEADSMMAEAMNDRNWKLPDLPRGGYRATAALIRYNGPYDWTLKDAGKIESFYESKFGRSLPISAYGQTTVHNELGFDHRNAVDIAVQPDSPEGQALMAYLRSEGIPFIAFRHAVPGSATGAHIHVGPPSHRLR
jgi:hypothetical protein